MVQQWNSVVQPQDHVYHLGDVAMQRQHLSIVKRLQGHKRLVRGNHDIFKTKEYLVAGFKEIHGMRVIEQVVLTHCPMHSQCLGRFIGNVHGHLHQNPSPPGRYLNVCVEPLQYTPIALEDAIENLKAKQEELTTLGKEQKCCNRTLVYEGTSGSIEHYRCPSCHRAYWWAK